MNIIDSNISGTQFDDLVVALKSYIEESIYTACNEEIIDTYREITINEYYAGEYDEIWNDNDELLGTGIHTVYGDYIMNEDTRPLIEKAFIMARDSAFKNHDEQ